MNISDLLESVITDTVVIDTVSFIGTDKAIVDFVLKEFGHGTFSIPVDAKQFLNKLAKDVGNKPKVTYKDPKGDSRYNVTEKDYKVKVVESPPIKKCKNHPNYNAERKPRSSSVNPKGCPQCWEYYRIAGKQ